MCLYKNNEKEEIVSQLGLWLVNVFCILHFIPLIYPIFSSVRIQFGSGSTALAKNRAGLGLVWPERPVAVSHADHVDPHTLRTKRSPGIHTVLNFHHKFLLSSGMAQKSQEYLLLQYCGL